jgi:hypothetical protein
MHNLNEQGEALSVSRKAGLFDNLLESVEGLMSDGSWYDIFRNIGMDDDEMRVAGLDLSEQKLTESAVSKMVDHIVDVIQNTHMEGHQLHVDFSASDLAERFDVDLESCQLAEDMVFAELFSREGINNAELIDGRLFVKPDNDLIARLHEPEPPGLTML